MRDREVTVLKFGGSVLRDEDDLRTAVHEVYRWLRTGGRVVAVVSAFEGTTDRLIRQAAGVDPAAHPVANPLLLATGELTTAALVVLALQRAGVFATALSPAAAGLRTDGAGIDANPVSINTAAIERALEANSVVVIPGFVGVDDDQQFTLLGRGGSDLTALFVAHELQAARCRLIKDVDGLYERDPALPGPRPRRFDQIFWDDALQLSEGIVQHKALRFARERGLEFEVGAFGRDTATRVGLGPTSTAAESTPRRPMRIALLGLGTVGGGVYQSLRSLPELFDVVTVGARSPQKAITAGVPVNVIETDLSSGATSDVDVVVELLGGVHPGTELIEQSLRAGRSVVTANKAVIARDGQRLQSIANSHGVQLVYSAAVGGSVPMLETASALSANSPILLVEGVLNGTCNFILNELAAGRSFAHAVAAAQRAGFAEADPTKDLSGDDAAEKLVLLARIALNADIRVEQVQRTALSEDVVGRLRALHGPSAVLRQVSRVERHPDGTVTASVGVEPVGKTSPLYALPGATNLAAFVAGDGETVSVKGAGAGRWPTSEAVCADLLELHRCLANETHAAVDTTSNPHIQSYQACLIATIAADNCASATKEPACAK